MRWLKSPRCPAAYRQYDNQLEALKEELKTLRAHIEAAQAHSIGDRIPGLTLETGGTSSRGGSGTEPDRRSD